MKAFFSIAILVFIFTMWNPPSEIQLPKYLDYRITAGISTEITGQKETEGSIKTVNKAKRIVTN